MELRHPATEYGKYSAENKIDALIDKLEEKLQHDESYAHEIGRWTIGHLDGYSVEVSVKVMKDVDK
jgi:hypothetical protein